MLTGLGNLLNKKVLETKEEMVDGKCQKIKLVFEGDATLEIEHKYGGGADGNWYSWVEVRCNGLKVCEFE